MRLYIIGRISTADIVISHNTISANHAQLMVDAEGNVFIHDLNSTNGTYVNGDKITSPVQLLPNDLVLLGKVPFDWQIHVGVNENPTLEADKSERKDKKKKSTSKTLITVLISSVVFVGIGLIIILLNTEWKNNTSFTTGGPNGQNNPETGSDYRGQKVPQDNKRDITYDLSCLRDENDYHSVDIIQMGSEIQDEMIRLTGPHVTPQEQMKVGEQVKLEFLSSPGLRTNQKLNTILQRMLEHLRTTSFTYEVVELLTDEINAFTIGGKIFLATGMLNFVKNDHELASVIGHEIYHNELGHIEKKLQVNHLARGVLGKEMGDLASQLHLFFSAPFNQKDEANCDLHGVDLVIKSGYNPCGSVDLWERMAKSEGDFNAGENMLRSHPFSSKRMGCIHHHLQQNYKRQCR